MPESDTADPVVFQRERERMVAEQIAGRGVRDERVLDAMRRVPREAFVPPNLAADAYEDGPLPIGDGQTISQPYIVALMIEAAALATRRGVPVILMSGHPEAQSAFDRHPYAHLNKPFRLGDLLALVRVTLR